MQVKCLEVRDSGTFIPVICIWPAPDNDAQRYLLRRDGYRGDDSETCVIMIDAQCRGVAYDCYDWKDTRTKRQAHYYIAQAPVFLVPQEVTFSPVAPGTYTGFVTPTTSECVSESVRVNGLVVAP